VFDCSFSEVAQVLDRSEAACRQLASRARTHVREARPRDESVARDRAGDAATRHEELISAFVTATRSGDLDALMSMLAEDARLVADGGGKVLAALNVIVGAKNTARFIVGATAKGLAEGTTWRFRPLNGLPGLIAYSPDGYLQTVAFEIEDDRIRTIYSVRNPDKLRHLPSA
jgi:RNA polymerase sigma-70 factor, ECF subfamily